MMFVVALRLHKTILKKKKKNGEKTQNEDQRKERQ